MKLTKEKLQKIIKEELAALDEQRTENWKNQRKSQVFATSTQNKHMKLDKSKTSKNY